MTPRFSILLLAILASAMPLLATPESWKEDVYDPKKPFESAYGEMLDFEKASIETTLRGFIAIGDSSPGYREQKAVPSHPPSKWGMNLNVGVSEDVRKSSDTTEIKDDLTHRHIALLSPIKKDPSVCSLEIEWIYGPKVKPGVIQAIDQCIARLKISASEKSDHPTSHFVDWIGSYDDDSSPWRVIVNENNPPVFGLGYMSKEEGSHKLKSSISPANWLPHQGWFVLIQDDTHLWAFDGLRKLLLYEINSGKDCLYEFSTKPPFNSLPYRPSDEVLNHLPQEYRFKVEESFKKPKIH